MDRNEGHIDFTVSGLNAKLAIWYQVVGNLNSGRPLVVVHGGPGLCHDYLLSVQDLATATRPLVFWDQIGSGRSTKLPDRLCDYEFWTEKFFLDQVTAVLTHLEIADEYDLLGQSWGGMLAATHAALQPLGLRRLVLSSTPYSSAMWTDAYKRYRDDMPEEIRQALYRTRKIGMAPDHDHTAALDQFYTKHFMDLDPLPEEIKYAYADLEQDNTVWMSTLGPDEFTWVGTMAKWTMEDRAQFIKTPTLLTNGVDEGADDQSQKMFLKHLDAKWVKFDHSLHMSHWEERDKFMRTVKDFLDA